MIEAIGVVVPAHDEERLLPACLEALQRAAAHPLLTHLPVRIAVVLDRCSDASGELAACGLRHCDSIVETTAGSVGAARRAGFARLAAGEAGRERDRIWLATTDADSTVPTDWLARQLLLAELGADAVAGTIAIDDWREQPAQARRRFIDLYHHDRNGAHTHVHGANLGVRASLLDKIGGMPEHPLAEDHALFSALVAAGAVIARPATLRVRTSARRESRAAGGFSDYLRRLE